MNVKTGLIAFAAASTLLVASAAGAFAAPARIAYGTSLYANPGWIKIGAVAGGQYVDVGGCGAGYCYVSKPGKDGYVKASAIKWMGGPVGWPYPDHHHHHHHFPWI